MPTPSPQVSERIRRRRDFCAFVELAREEESLTIDAAIAFVERHWPSPFPSQESYRSFMRRRRHEVTLRMAEIREDYENPFNPPGISREGLDSIDFHACSEAERKQIRQDNWEFLCRTKQSILSNARLLEEIVWGYIERKIVPALATT